MLLRIPFSGIGVVFPTLSVDGYDSPQFSYSKSIIFVWNFVSLIAKLWQFVLKLYGFATAINTFQAKAMILNMPGIFHSVYYVNDDMTMTTISKRSWGKNKKFKNSDQWETLMIDTCVQVFPILLGQLVKYWRTCCWYLRFSNCRYLPKVGISVQVWMIPKNFVKYPPILADSDTKNS